MAEGNVPPSSSARTGGSIVIVLPLTAAERSLTIDDLDTVLTALHESRVKWYYVGLKLKVPEHVLETIKKQSSDLDDCLLEVLRAVLKRAEPVTWRALIEALKSPTVRMDQLAKEIEAEYCPPPTPDTLQGMYISKKTHFDASVITHLFQCLLTHPSCQPLSLSSNPYGPLKQKMQRRLRGCTNLW